MEYWVAILRQVLRTAIARGLWRETILDELVYVGLGNHANDLIVNCYSLMKIGNGQAIGYNVAAGGIKNSYYLNGIANFASESSAEWNGATAKSDSYMKSQAFVDALNNGGDVWTRDDNINEGYPILKSIKYKK